jgi:hypothetical protein
MRCEFLITVALAITSSALADDRNAAPRSLRILYVGNADTDRGRSYASFLSEKFTLVGAQHRKAFDPRAVPDVDVIVLDWSQSDVDRGPSSVRTRSLPESDLKSPLGERSLWTKPTVLLGSAGHLLAAPWQVFGGSG